MIASDQYAGARLASVFNNRGLAYYQRQDYAHAIADYSEAIRLNPQFGQAFNNRGNAYDDQGDHDRAIADYSEAIRLNAQFELAFFNRAIVYESQGDSARAIADYNEVLRITPQNALATAAVERLQGARTSQAPPPPPPTPSPSSDPSSQVAAGTELGAWRRSDSSGGGSHPGLITNPDWARRPSGEEMARYYPEGAARTETDGSVQLHCSVAANGSLTGCSVSSESPPDMGFGEAAMRLSRSFGMRPQQRDGTSVGGAEVNIPITFRYPREVIPSDTGNGEAGFAPSASGAPP